MDKTTLPGAEARALDLFDLITTSQFEAAGADFDETMTEKLPTDTLANNWAQAISQVGEYDGAGTPTVRRQGDYTVVDIPLRFEAGELVGRVAFQRDGKITGLFFLNPDFVKQH
ncbi:uncharacterized protein DUF3887 [Rhodococcus sp. OK611]|jgi:hypothetical protein|uniref:DUF3887 domain-containing protein n=2 Tax=Nocardiaceae TaxID=85025 RepID=UPI000BCA88C0|nr:DUF3887 domain-containing protein [Rhodococcus sp. OK270]MCZ4558590.1 DUF3887 domain-containing protein [Rhodococcus maanshanensis]PTR38987.1 uncharacterized protein DUF3887 [Rhodococcus sp. OK611]SNX92773.1 Protein of unknown function [Rhodococcus sp. OK270]